MKVWKKIQEIKNEIEKNIERGKRDEMMRDGLNVVIVGEKNEGK